MIEHKSFELNRNEIKKSGRATYEIDGKNYLAEEAVIKCFEADGYSGLWSENVYWWVIMFLLFWDVIFAHVK